MKKSVSVFVVMMGLMLVFNLSAAAQEDKIAGKLFYVELGGPGVIMSANFDARFSSKARLGLGYRLGAGFGIGKVKTKWVDKQWDYTYIENITRSYYTFPAGLNYVFGKPNSANTFEVGAGATYLTRKVSLYNHEVKKPGKVIGYLNFMYRIMPVNSGFSFRIGCTPIIGTAGDLYPMGALSFGYSF